MSLAFSADELAWMRAAQDGHMPDTGNVMPYSANLDSFAQSVNTWPTDSASIACGLDMRPGSEKLGSFEGYSRSIATGTILEYDATVRVPIGTSVDVRDRFKVTKRFGETLSTALVFDIVAPPQRGPSGLRLLLKRIET